MLKDKNILYIVHTYYSFEKDSIELLAKEFRDVYVVVRYKPIAEISKFIPIKKIAIHRKDFVIQDKNKPDNVHIFTAPLWYLPIKFFYQRLGKYHFRVVDWVIQKNKIKFDIIHAHFTWTSGYVAMMLHEKYDIPFVVTIHSSKRFKEQLKSSNQIVYSIWRKASAVIKVNDNIQELKEYNKNTYFIPNGFNRGLFYPEDKNKCRDYLGLNKNKKILLSVGILEKCKGHIYLLRAIHSLVNIYGYKNILLYIIGEGSYRYQLEEEIKRLNLEKYVKLVGRKLHKEVPSWMNSCDIFVLPSLRESFGIVQLEAFACGKPIVATETEGSRLLITSDKYGYLCSIGNSEDLAQKLNYAIKTDWDRNSMIGLSKNFTLDKVMNRVLEVYKNILKT